jgi:glutathione S-transferase
VIESTIILEYLEDAFPDHPMRPEAPIDRARMRVWTKTPDDGLHAACGTVTYAAAFVDQVVAFHGMEVLQDRIAKLPDRARAARQKEMYEKGIDASIVPAHVKLHEKVLRNMETELLDKDWLAGETFSLAECAMLPYIWRLERLNFAQMWADKPNVADWFARAKARPSWDHAMEAYQPLGGDDYNDDLKSKGIDLWPKIKAMIDA